eukprot:1684036-Amphidinium_carterae.1
MSVVVVNLLLLLVRAAAAAAGPPTETPNEGLGESLTVTTSAACSVASLVQFVQNHVITFRATMPPTH